MSVQQTERDEGGAYHVAHLICNVLQPCLRRLRASNHTGELTPDHSLATQGFAERLALVHPLQALLHDRPLSPCRTTAHYPALVVEVGQNDKETGALGPKRVLYWHLDVVERHVRRTRHGRVGSLDCLRLYALLAWDKDGRQAVIRLATNGEARDPDVRIE